MLPAPVERAVGRYLARADRLLDRPIIGFYVVGSIAKGGYRERRSDIDFVAVVDGDALDARRLRAVFYLSGLRTGAPAVARGLVSFPGTCNGVYVSADQLDRPVSKIEPIASHAGHDFHLGRAFDANPVVWKTFAEHGIAVRGPAPSTLGLDPEPETLVDWNRRNLDRYWRPSAESAVHRPRPRARLTPRWHTAWTVLGPPRLHHTIATGEVITKEEAGEYALATFDARWHPIISDALAYWREEPADPSFADWRQRSRASGEFALEVVRSAETLA